MKISWGILAGGNCGRGAIEGIYNLLSKAETEYVFVCGSDMPNVTGEVADYLGQFISSDYDCWCMTSEGKAQPLCAIYSKDMLPAIQEAIDAGEYGLEKLLERCRTKFVKIEFSCFGQEVLLNKRIKSHEAPQVPRAVFCVCGYKNSGKTGLIVKLINEFINRGFSVGAIKHDGHDYVMDRTGTDTQRFAAAGAQKTIIFSQNRYSLNGIFKPETEGRFLPRIGEGMIKLCGGTDIVIIEGLKHLSYPKIVIGNIKAEKIICRIIEKKTEFPESSNGETVLERDDIEGIFLCLKEYFGLPDRA